MKYGIAHLSVIPIRAQASECAEMVSQLLFGDAYAVIEESGRWLQIKTCDCDYVGWMDKKLFNPIDESDVKDYLSAQKFIVREQFFILKSGDGKISFPVFLGSSFPYPQNGQIRIGNKIFLVDAKLAHVEVDFMDFAKKFLHAPYLWGGRSLAGIDCSGFSQLVFKNIGIQLPRDASQQAQLGNIVDFVAESKLGDLAFFQNDAGNIIHVGVICGEGQIIHASGCVRIDKLDETGIFNVDTQEYTHNLRFIKRVL